MKRAILIASIVMTSVAFGQVMSGQDSQNGRGDRDNGRDNGRDDNGRNGRTAICENYAPFNMCTGQDIFVWKAPYVDRRTTKFECMDLCNRKLREMNFRGDACCQLQHHPDFPSNCKLKNGTLRRLDDNAGSTVGAAMCERGYEPPRPPRNSTCKPYEYTRFSACTGRDIQVWMPPYVNRRTSPNDCVELCNRQLRDMNFNGYACCQLQQHPDHPANCRLRDGMTNSTGGDFVGAVNCGPEQGRR